MRTIGCALLAATIIGSRGEGQSPGAPTGVLRGFVLADSTEQPIVGAEVTIEALKLSVRSVGEGAFRLGNVPPGTYIVHVRAVGYQPIWAQMAFVETDSLERDFLLARSVVAIAGVNVKGKAEIHNPKLAEFERRRAGGFGHFVTQATIDSFPARRLSNFLATLPGLSIQHGNSSVANWAVGTRLSGSILKRPAISIFDKVRGAKVGICYSSVLLDGASVYSGKEGEALFDLDQIQSSEVAGIEFYASAAQMPPELNMTTSGTCGVVVIWTR
ncbi:MAG TPA: carboxypeptidase regulatory-like domain-containing protein [Gemmatimonadaceae bacterium]|nr:carboxypeptidase regulatory-like domain-containing protein [Gemmatimonadaceae bacterium]